MFLPYAPRTRGERWVLLILLAASGITLILIGIFYALNPRTVMGDALVNTSSGAPLEFPPPGTFPFYLKPVTIFFLAAVAFSYCFFALLRPRIGRLPRWLLALFLVISIVIFAGAVYEVLFNFTLWGSILVSNPNPDLAVNRYPLGSFYETNLVFATKAYLALVFIAYFALSTFRHSLGSMP